MTDVMQQMTNTQLTRPTEQSATRLFAIDSAKGIGILLVVFGHAWRGLMGAGVLTDGVMARTVDAAVYAFHMPLFFFLSGLLFLETLQKYDASHLLRGRVTRLLWPMALWSWLFFGLKLAAGGQANSPVALSDFPLVPLPPYEHLWFLWALFLCQTLLIGVYALGMSRLDDKILRIAAGAVAVVLAVLNPFMSVPSLVWGPMVEHIPYFLAGIAGGGLVMLRPSLSIGVFAGAGFVVMTAILGPQKASIVWSLALIILGWVAWQAIDRSSPACGRVLQGLRYLGQVSMVIYLTHTAFSAAFRIILLKAGVQDPVTLLLVTVGVGILAPIAVLWSARRLRLVRILGF